MNQPLTLKGFRDILPSDVILRQKAIEILRNTFEEFGFLPLETPTIEYASTLLGKYGEEADKLMYTFKDKGDRDVGLRYDLTVPVCKVLALYSNSQITLPFKRYQIQNVFRADKPQKGRLREFTQCDIDTFGITSPLADAEIIVIIYQALKAIGFKNFRININSRQVLFRIMQTLDIGGKEKQLQILRSIDKLDKIGPIEVENELISKGFSKDIIDKIFKTINEVKPDEELTTIFDFLKKNNVKEDYFTFKPFMVRGLDYYTRAIYETTINDAQIGSITGGGRYDNLVKQLGGPDITGTGTSFGFERIIEAIKDLNLWPDLALSKTKVLMTIFSKELLDESIKIAQNLREKGIITELYLDPAKKLDSQIKYADKKKIPWVVIIGPEEKEKEMITVKDMINNVQKTVNFDEFVSLLK